jgi:hypothetical protein
VVVSEDGSLFVMSSTERGIEIHFVGAPELSLQQLPASRWNLKPSTAGLRDCPV